MAAVVDHVAILRSQVQEEAQDILKKTNSRVEECLALLRAQLAISTVLGNTIVIPAATQPKKSECETKNAEVATAGSDSAVEDVAGTRARHPQSSSLSSLPSCSSVCSSLHVGVLFVVAAARADAAIFDEFGFNKETLEDQTLARRQLQQICKNHGIKANGKTSRLYAQLTKCYDELLAKKIDELSEQGGAAAADSDADAEQSAVPASPFAATTATSKPSAASATKPAADAKSSNTPPAVPHKQASPASPVLPHRAAHMPLPSSATKLPRAAQLVATATESPKGRSKFQSPPPQKRKASRELPHQNKAAAQEDKETARPTPVDHAAKTLRSAKNSPVPKPQKRSASVVNDDAAAAAAPKSGYSSPYSQKRCVLLFPCLRTRPHCSALECAFMSLDGFFA